MCVIYNSLFIYQLRAASEQGQTHFDKHPVGHSWTVPCGLDVVPIVHVLLARVLLCEHITSLYFEPVVYLAVGGHVRPAVGLKRLALPSCSCFCGTSRSHLTACYGDSSVCKNNALPGERTSNAARASVWRSRAMRLQRQESTRLCSLLDRSATHAL